MATILNELRASGGTDVIINTIELRAENWPQSLMLCDGFVDLTVFDENGIAHAAKATGIPPRHPAA